MIRNRIRFLVFILLGFAGKSNAQSPSFCSTNRFTDVALFDSSDIVMDTGLVYGISRNYFSGLNDTLRMNIFYPGMNTDTMNARPFILLIHGGAFISGGLHDMDYQCMAFARRGFVTATISYRLGWNCSGTDFLSICLLCGSFDALLKTATYQAAQDGRAAMRYIDANHSTYRIDPDNYFIGGTSAGSITAMHAAFWDQQEADEFCPWASGQVGMLDTAGNALPDNFHIRGVIDNCGAVSKDSVVLNNGDIPVISFHDEGDCIVPNQYGQVISCLCQSFYWVAGSSALHGKLAANGICASMNLVPLSINHCSFPEYELVNRASCFIRSVLCDSCQSSFNNTPYVLQHCSSSIGTGDLGPLYGIHLYPNPAAENVFMEGLQARLTYELELFDLAGRKIAGSQFNGTNGKVFETDLFPGGLYILKIICAGQMRYFKLAIKK